MSWPSSPLWQRFLDKVIIKKGRCWIWKGSRSATGYGHIRDENRHMTHAHRIAYRLFVGEISQNTLILHRCDNPGCVNPSHLFAGSHLDNMRDRTQKGRTARGYSIRKMLSEADVLNIRKSKDSSRRIAKRYGIGATTVQDIKNRRTWKHLP